MAGDSVARLWIYAKLEHKKFILVKMYGQAICAYNVYGPFKF